MPNFTTVTDTKSAFRREGYAVARGVLGSDEVAALTDRVDRYVNQYVPTMDPMHFFCDDTAAEQAHKARIKQKWQDEGHI